MPGPPVRRAGPGDLPALLTLVAEFCATDGHPFDEAHVRRGLVPLLAGDDAGQVWLAEGAAGYPEGYAVLTWSWSLESGGRECILDELYVRERGRGTGRLLLDAALAAAGAAGARVVFLETEAPNERARAFYRRAGFAVEDSVWMRRELDGGSG